MIAYAVETGRAGKLTVSNSLGESVTSDDLEQLLAFCLMPHPNEFRVFSDLNDAAAPLLAKLPIANIKELLKVNRTQHGQFTLIYFKDKVLTVFSGRQYAAYYNLSQYLPALEGLELEGIAKRGTDFVSELWDIGIKPDKLSSPITAISPILEKLQLCTWRNIPDDVGEAAWEASGRAWTEAHRIGTFSKTFDYDITGAYGSILANLLELKEGKEYCGRWVHEKEPPSNAVYGLAYGKMNIRSNISPMTLVAKDGSIFNPKGSWSSYFTLPEIKFVRNFDIGSFTPSEGWFWIPTRKVNKLHWTVWKFFRERTKSPALNGFLKRAIAGIAGKFLETFSDEGFGKLFNPVYGAHIQASVRCAVGEFILRNNLSDGLLAVSTDGVLCTKKIELPVDDRMGSWRLDGEGSALIAASSLVWFGKKCPNQISFQQAVDLIQSHPRAYEWHLKKKRRITLGDIASNMGNLDRLGKEMTIGTGFSLQQEHDRDFALLPINGAELLRNTYESKPLSASDIPKAPMVTVRHERL